MGILPSPRADSFLNWLLIPARLYFHYLRAIYKVKQNYPLNNLFLKILGIINDEEATSGFPFGEEQIFLRSVLWLACPEASWSREYQKHIAKTGDHNQDT